MLVRVGDRDRVSVRVSVRVRVWVKVRVRVLVRVTSETSWCYNKLFI